MREKYYPTQRQAIPWLCPAHGSSQKGSPGEEKERRKGREEKEEKTRRKKERRRRRGER